MAPDLPHKSYGRHSVCVPADGPSKAIEKVERVPVVGTMAAHPREAGSQRDRLVEVQPGNEYCRVGEKCGRKPHPLAHCLTQGSKMGVSDMMSPASLELWVDSSA